MNGQIFNCKFPPQPEIHLTLFHNHGINIILSGSQHGRDGVSYSSHYLSSRIVAAMDSNLFRHQSRSSDSCLLVTKRNLYDNGGRWKQYYDIVVFNLFRVDFMNPLRWKSDVVYADPRGGTQWGIEIVYI